MDGGSAAADRNSRAKSRSDTASSELAQGRSKPKAANPEVCCPSVCTLLRLLRLFAAIAMPKPRRRLAHDQLILLYTLLAGAPAVAAAMY